MPTFCTKSILICWLNLVHKYFLHQKNMDVKMVSCKNKIIKIVIIPVQRIINTNHNKDPRIFHRQPSDNLWLAPVPRYQIKKKTIS